MQNLNETLEYDALPPLSANLETKEIIDNFIIQYSDLELDAKRIKNKMKDLKNDYKEEGLPVQLLISIYKQVQKEKSVTEGELYEMDTLKTWLHESEAVEEAILKLN